MCILSQVNVSSIVSAPAKPKIDSVMPTDPVCVGSKMGSLHVTWQVGDGLRELNFVGEILLERKKK